MGPVLYLPSSDLELEILECIWVEIKPINSKSFLVAHIYRPPNSTIQWNDLFEESLEKALGLELEMYILGDFNRDLLKDHVNNPWLDYAESFGLTQIIQDATRVTNSSTTPIDHIYCNARENVTFVGKLGLVTISQYFSLANKIPICQKRNIIQ